MSEEAPWEAGALYGEIVCVAGGLRWRSWVSKCRRSTRIGGWQSREVHRGCVARR